MKFFMILSCLVFVLSGQYLFAQNSHTRKDTVWIVQRYEPKDDFIIGIWSWNRRIDTHEEIDRLKNYYGFTHVFLTLHIAVDYLQSLKNSGYPPDKIMVQISPENFRQRIKEFGSVYAYYLDEPMENNLPIEGVKDYIDKYAPGSLFIISGYRRNSRQKVLVDKTDGIMYSSYKHWWQCLPGVWCSWPVDVDQRPDWSDMKERYGSKSYTNWVGAHRDTLEYYDLLEHAADLNLEGVWLYQYQDLGNNDKNLLDFIDAAWNAGYMRKYERKYIYEYSCNSSMDSDCEWKLNKINVTDEIRKINR